MPAALLPEQGWRSLNDQKRAEEVRLEQRVNVSLAGFLNRTYQGVPCVIENDVQPAERRVGLRNGLPYLFIIGCAERQGKNRVAEEFPEIGDVGQFSGCERRPCRRA